MTDEQGIVLRENAMPALSDHAGPLSLQNRLEELKVEKGLVAAFFKDVMVPSDPGKANGDYGVIPGTDGVALLKSGAEKLCDYFGYAITVKDARETVNDETGFLRVVTTIALVQRSSGIVITEGVGEANTREARYAYRWLTMQRCRDMGIDPVALKLPKQARRKGNSTWDVYRVDNDDPFTLWNTVRKMSKKRALVDAVLSATRSTGIFLQSMEGIGKWAEAEWHELDAEEEDEEEAPYEESLKKAEAESATKAAAAEEAGVAEAPSRIFGEPTLADRQAGLKDKLVAAHQTLKGDDKANYVQYVRDTYPHAVAGNGMIQPSKFTAEQCEELGAYIDGLLAAIE